MHVRPRNAMSAIRKWNNPEVSYFERYKQTIDKNKPRKMKNAYLTLKLLPKIKIYPTETVPQLSIIVNSQS